MEYAEKLFLVPQNQIDKLKMSNTRESIQQTVEDDLDLAIRNILNKDNLAAHEKAKLYTSVLQRFLTVVKQGDRASNTLTLAFPPPDASHKESFGPPVEDGGGDDLIADVLKNVPLKSVKNARYIMDKMSKAKEVSSWNDSGEFVFKGVTIQGSHVLDLVKSITSPHKIRNDRRPHGWTEFLQAIAVLNIPYSTVPNHTVRHVISSFKTKPSTSSSMAQRMYLSTPSSKGSEAFKSPSREQNEWLSF